MRLRPSGGRRALKEELRAEREQRQTLQATLERLVEEACGEAPPELYAAASAAGADGVPVRTKVDGQEVILVIGPEAGESVPMMWAGIRKVVGGRMAS